MSISIWATHIGLGIFSVILFLGVVTRGLDTELGSECDWGILCVTLKYSINSYVAKRQKQKKRYHEQGNL